MNINLNENPLYEQYTGKDAKALYEKVGIRWIEPMTAKELETEEAINEAFSSDNVYIEEKFDGTRGILHFLTSAENRQGFARIFSRRVSNVTGWFCENSDSLPHLRDISIQELAGTIIDGEMFIDGRPFKDVSSTLNCLPAKAISRQKEIGFITFHAFDILWYKGVDVRKCPLHKRKEFLNSVITTLKKHDSDDFIKPVPYFIASEGYTATLTKDEVMKLANKLKSDVNLNTYATSIQQFGSLSTHEVFLTAERYYDYIVTRGGEGVIVKDIFGKYFFKRGREYQKIKKYLTRDVIVVGFNEPEKDYKGKFPNNKWMYWVDENGQIIINTEGITKSEAKKLNYKPVSKYFANDWVGNVIYGVIIFDEDMKELSERKNHVIISKVLDGVHSKVLLIGECSGFDENQRHCFTECKEQMIGKVIEVKANEVFKDTGKMRHPRFMRIREDKSAYQCTWVNHVGDWFD